MEETPLSKDDCKVRDLEKKDEPLTSEVQVDKYTDKVSASFDYEFDGKSEFKPWRKPDIDDDFDIGIIVGSSGSGKSTLLNEFGDEKEVEWNSEQAR